MHNESERFNRRKAVCPEGGARGKAGGSKRGSEFLKSFAVDESM